MTTPARADSFLQNFFPLPVERMIRFRMNLSIPARQAMVKDSLLKIFDKFGGLTIGVLGDFALDAYWMLDGEAGEISVETGKRAYAVASQRYSPGGAGNIVANLAALGVGRVEAFGVRGEDLFGGRLMEELTGRGIVTQGIIPQKENWDTHVWAKPHMEGEELRRFDFGFFNQPSERTLETLLDHLAARVETLDALIVNRQLPRPLVTGLAVEWVNGLIER
ncbi:MAG: PfkB family carbohydrate kinase, partial [Candidatus Glassbacteria bacterium]